MGTTLLRSKRFSTIKEKEETPTPFFSMPNRRKRQAGPFGARFLDRDSRTVQHGLYGILPALFGLVNRSLTTNRSVCTPSQGTAFEFKRQARGVSIRPFLLSWLPHLICRL
jgi:hypothetical protein